jgi:hypothetical protein
MSNVDERMSLADAQALAQQFVDRIAPHCVRVEIAGSIRRGKSSVGDIEIVAQTERMMDDALDQHIEHLSASGEFTPHLANDKARAWGARYKAGWFAGRRLDLFIVRPDREWGVTFLIRTGPGDANKELVTRRLYQGDGGITPAHLAFEDGALWRLPYEFPHTITGRVPVGSVRIPTPEETDVFEQLGLPYIQPEDRAASEYHRQRKAHTVALRVPKTAITVFTGRINSGDPDALETTIAGIEGGRTNHLGAALTPTWEMVNAHKDQTITDAEYAERYLALLRWRYSASPQMFLDIFNRPRVVLTCYCADGAFCHRHLAVEVLEKIAFYHGIPFTRGGELNSAPIISTITQLTLFDLPTNRRIRGYE